MKAIKIFSILILLIISTNFVHSNKAKALLQNEKTEDSLDTLDHRNNWDSHGPSSPCDDCDKEYCRKTAKLLKEFLEKECRNCGHDHGHGRDNFNDRHNCPACCHDKDKKYQTLLAACEFCSCDAHCNAQGQPTIVCDPNHPGQCGPSCFEKGCSEAPLLTCATDGHCYECTSNDDSHCPPSKPYCDVTTGPGGVCSTCTTAICCALGKKCGTSEPVNGQCVDCLTNEDCGVTPNTPICSSTGTCVPCSGPQDCAGFFGLPACNTATGACVPCIDDSTCPTLTACNPFNNQCGCTPCSCEFSGLFCADSGNCVQCLVDGNCFSPTPYCEESTGTCIDCTSDATVCETPQSACGPLGLCVCQQSDCSGSTPFCDSGTGVCRACTPADCTGSNPPYCQASSGTCITCTTDPTVCLAPQSGCDPSGLCVCQQSDCTGSTPICDANGTGSCQACTPADCTSNPVCATSTVCQQTTTVSAPFMKG